MGLGGDLGSVIGSRIGDWGQKLLGFKKGGRVGGTKGKAKLAVIHGGEVIIPNTMPSLQKKALKEINKRRKK